MRIPGWVGRGFVTWMMVIHLSGCQVSFFSKESKDTPLPGSTVLGSVQPPEIDRVVLPSDGSTVARSLGIYYSQSSRIQVEGSCSSGALIEATSVGDLSSSSGSRFKTTCILGRFELILERDISSTDSGSFSFDLRQGELFSEIADVIVYTYSESVRLNWAIDRIAPSPPSLSPGLGLSQTTGTDSFEITGSCETGNFVLLTGADSSSQTCQNESFSFTVSHQIDASYVYGLSQRDLAGNESQSITFTWTRVSVSEASFGILSYLFAATAVSSTSSHTLDLTNTGAVDLVLTQALTTANLGLASSAFSVTGGTCTTASLPLTLAPQSSCSIEVTFSPVTSGVSSGTLSLSYSNGLTTQTVSLALSGVGHQANLTYFNGSTSYTGGSSFHFTSTYLGESTSVTLTVRNTGSDSASFTSPTASSLGISGSAFDLTGGTCQSLSTLGVDATCSLILSFTPTVIGSAIQFMTLSYSSAGVPQSVSLALSGIGLGSNVLMSGSLSSFTDIAVGSDVYTVVEVSNTGNSSVSLLSYDSLSSPFSFVSGSGTTCLMGTTVLGAGETCTQVIRYLPLTSGTPQETLKINYSDAQGAKSASYVLSGVAESAPTAPTLSSILPSPVPSPSPSPIASTSPYYSNSNAIILSGSCTTGNTVELGGDESQSTSCVSQSYQFHVSSSLNGVKNYVITQVNASNISSSVTSLQWVRDTLTPSAPTIDHSNPFASGDNSVIITGTCEPGATVSLLGVSGPAAITDPAPVTCSSLGTYSITSGAQSTNGTYLYSIRQRDLALNVSPDLSWSWMRDSSLPATPIISSPSLVKTYTNQNSITVSGSGCSQGNSMTLVDTYNHTSYSTTCGLGGNFSVIASPTPSISPSADPGSDHPLLLYQTDADTGVNSGSAQKWVVHDTVKPQDPVLIFPSPLPTYLAGGKYLNLGGSCDEEGSTLGITGSSPAPFSGVCSDRSFRFQILETVDNSSPGYHFTVTQTDLANNSSLGTLLYWYRDSSLPPAPEISSPSVNTVYSNQNSIVVSGYCNKGYTVALSGDVSSSDVTTPSGSLTQSCLNGKWRFVIAKGTTSTAASPFVFKFTQSQSTLTSPSSVIQWVRETTAPVITVDKVSSDSALVAQFNFSSDKIHTVQFQCSLDDPAAYTPCTSPVFYTPSNAPHTLYVRGVDSAGNVSVPGVTNGAGYWSWTQAAQKTLALYHFDGASLSSINPSPAALADSGSLGNTLAITSSAQLSTTASSSTPLTSGNQYFLTFASPSPTPGVLYAPLSSSLGTASQSGYLQSVMTVEMYINPDSQVTTWNGSANQGKVYVLASKTGDSSGNYGWQFGVKQNRSNQSSGGSNQSSHVLSFKMSADGGNSLPQEVTSSIFSLNSGTWYHVALVFNQGSVTFYVDGVAKGAGSILGSASSLEVGHAQLLRIGSNNSATTFDPYSNRFHGSLDEFRLSQSVRYTTSFTPPVTPFTAD